MDAAYRNGLRVCNQEYHHVSFRLWVFGGGIRIESSVDMDSPDAEPSPSQLAIIAQFAKTNNVQYIFLRVSQVRSCHRRLRRKSSEDAGVERLKVC